MPTPLYDKFHQFQDATRWCTPSIHPELRQTLNIYENDMSVSYHELGSPHEDTDLFGEATELAALAYQADHTLFGVHGTTGSNNIVIKGLQDQMKGKLHILSSRNIHMSIVTAVEDYGVELDYIPPALDGELHIFSPNTADQIVESMREHKPNALLLSNPTYEGASVDLPAVVSAVRGEFPDTIIFVDEAWGAHLPFSDKLPVSAMQAGADICTQSTHKQGNGLQQTSMIHWRNGKIDQDALRAAYRNSMTTSPSFHLLASMDATREFMEERGAEEINKLIELSDDFRWLLEKIGHCAIHSLDDPTKLLLHFPDRNAGKIAHRLEKQGIISEKAEAHNLLLIAGFQSTHKHVMKTTQAIAQVADLLPSEQSSIPPFPATIEKAKPAEKAELLPVQDAIGKVCLGYVIPYPPGIPVLTKNEVITEEHADYLVAALQNPQTTVMGAKDGCVLVAKAK